VGSVEFCKIKAFAHVNTLHLFLQTLPPAATNPFTRVDVNEYPARCEQLASFDVNDLLVSM
jgi:hypothetical protein